MQTLSVTKIKPPGLAQSISTRTGATGRKEPWEAAGQLGQGSRPLRPSLVRQLRAQRRPRTRLLPSMGASRGMTRSGPQGRMCSQIRGGRALSHLGFGQVPFEPVAVCDVAR
jgi:hypothetical protein